MPIAVGLGAIAVALAAGAARACAPRRPARLASRAAAGIREAERAAARPSWRVGAALGYLGFDIAVLWASLRGLGYAPAIGALVVAYLAGYLATWLPIPGGLGVLDGGLAGALVLYGMPPASAAAAVLVYHAIALWVPSMGGLIAYTLLRRKLVQAKARHPARGGGQRGRAHTPPRAGAGAEYALGAGSGPSAHQQCPLRARVSEPPRSTEASPR